jgi:copper chaperone NosL
MSALSSRSVRFLHQPIRLLLVAAALLVLIAYFLPLWNLTMFAPQYPNGLRLDIYDHTLVGGNGGQDIKEINLLNHYIGMHDLTVDDFTEFKWMPFVLGGIALLFLRAAVLGTVKEMVDAIVVFAYFGGFSLWSLGYSM